MIELTQTIPGGIILRIAPIEVRSVADGDDWLVSVWYAQAITMVGEAVVDDWRTASYRMRWEEGTWKIADLQLRAWPDPRPWDTAGLGICGRLRDSSRRLQRRGPRLMDIPGVDLPGPGDIIGGVGGFFGGLAEDAGQAIVEYVIEFIFGLIAQAVASITGALAGAFNGDSTRVDLAGGWFTSDGGSTVTTMTSVVAGSLVLVFLFMSLIRAMAAGEFSTMWRAALVDVPVAFLATALTVVVASALLAMVDEASATLLGSDGEQLAAFGESLTDVEQLSLAGLLGILFGLLFIIGAVLVWIQLLVRAALIYIVIAFAPITWVTRAYPGTRGIARRGAEVAVALIVSKFAMAISFRLGAEAMGSAEVASGEADLSSMLVGAAIMLMTAFMPWMIFKIIPAVESATSAAGAERAAVGAAVVGGGLAYAGLRHLASGSGSASGASGGGAGSSQSGGGGGSDSGSGGSPGGGGGGGSGGGSGGSAAAAGATTGATERGTDTPNASRGSAGEGEGGEVGANPDDRSSAAGSPSSTSASGDQTGQAAGRGDAVLVATPIGGSPGVGVIEIEADRPAAPAPAAEPDSAQPQTLARMRRSQP